jgi:hypothetical protein
VILSGWDFNEVYGNGEDDDSGNNDDGNAFIDVEYGHDGFGDADLMITTTTSDRDDSNDDDE